MTDSDRHLAQTEERLGTTLLELEKVKGKYLALNSAYKELLEQLFQPEQSEEPRHFFYGPEDIH